MSQLNHNSHVPHTQLLFATRQHQKYTAAPEEIERMLDIVRGGLHNHGIELSRRKQLLSVFQPHDWDRTGRQDLQEFTKVVQNLINHHLSDYQVELLFNHFADEVCYPLCCAALRCTVVWCGVVRCGVVSSPCLVGLVQGRLGTPCRSACCSTSRCSEAQ